MKKIDTHLLFLALLATLCGACSDHSTIKPASTGRAYEMIVVSERSKWDAALGDTLRAIFLQPVEMINQREPLMDMLPVIPSSFSGILQNHRNILIATSGSEFAVPSIGVAYDVYAAPQVIVQLTGPSDSAITAYAWDHRAELLQVFEMAERDRFTEQTSSYPEKRIGEKVESKFGFMINIPKGYEVSAENPDFLWISKELPLVSKGVIIYSYPYLGKSDFELDSLVSKRNRFVQRIPGPSDGSFMTTADMEPDLNYMRINGRFWSVMHGFWDVEGDYMGGPFISYSTLDVASNRVICIDTYLFSPKHRKRNHVRELEQLVYGVTFPDSTPVPAAEK